MGRLGIACPVTHYSLIWDIIDVDLIMGVNKRIIHSFTIGVARITIRARQKKIR